MQYLKTYLKTISSRGNEKLAESISHTAEDVGNRYIKSFSFCSHEIGLLFGNVQSGKTGQMFGIMCKAADLGFPAFVLLTTDNVVLQQQTLDRVKADLLERKVQTVFAGSPLERLDVAIRHFNVGDCGVLAHQMLDGLLAAIGFGLLHLLLRLLDLLHELVQCLFQHLG